MASPQPCRVSDTTRIVIEQASRRFYKRVVPDLVPLFVFYDADNSLFAMEAAPPSALIWKNLLMARSIDFGIRCRIAGAFALVHAAATDPDMGRNYLWYRHGDAINAVLAATGYNFIRRNNVREHLSRPNGR